MTTLTETGSLMRQAADKIRQQDAEIDQLKRKLEAFDELVAACKVALPFLKDCVERRSIHPSNFTLARVGADAEDSLRAIEAALRKAGEL